MPGYPNERQSCCAVFLTRHSVRIVPAAPSWEATLTAVVWSEQSGIVGAAAFVELEVEGVVVGVVA
jgi:hypothetical protein